MYAFTLQGIHVCNGIMSLFQMNVCLSDKGLYNSVSIVAMSWYMSVACDCYFKQISKQNKLE